jgi:hypothetical protein
VGEKFCHRLFSRVRVVVEQVIAGVKRCWIVKEVWRLTTAGIADVVREMACGLPNLRVSCRHPLPALTLLHWVNST